MAELLNQDSDVLARFIEKMHHIVQLVDTAMHRKSGVTMFQPVPDEKTTKSLELLKKVCQVAAGAQHGELTQQNNIATASVVKK